MSENVGRWQCRRPWKNPSGQQRCLANCFPTKRWEVSQTAAWYIKLDRYIHHEAWLILINPITWQFPISRVSGGSRSRQSCQRYGADAPSEPRRRPCCCRGRCRCGGSPGGQGPDGVAGEGGRGSWKGPDSTNLEINTVELVFWKLVVGIFHLKNRMIDLRDSYVWNWIRASKQ